MKISQQFIKQNGPYNLGILGYEWDMTAGGKSPDDTKLGASANWRKTATSLKDTAGVLVKTK